VIRSARWLLVLAASTLGLVQGVACSDPGGGAEPPSARSSERSQPAASKAAPAPERAAPAAAPAPSREALVERGRSVYMANCTACHGMDPTQAGGLGPAVAGASRELLEARVLHATYPEGYTPRRDTQLMVALPHLADDIDALAAYLDERS